MGQQLLIANSNLFCRVPNRNSSMKIPPLHTPSLNMLCIICVSTVSSLKFCVKVVLPEELLLCAVCPLSTSHIGLMQLELGSENSTSSLINKYMYMLCAPSSHCWFFLKDPLQNYQLSFLSKWCHLAHLSFKPTNSAVRLCLDGNKEKKCITESDQLFPMYINFELYQFPCLPENHYIWSFSFGFSRYLFYAMRG